ncbi:tautomerase family protein [Xanthomonas hortorum]|uniref:Tautomerase family protein n=1 Tax=Xanthomonas hortorum pv. hederae TaxID=453603 RepID=A0A9X3YZH9_9XANT|nr:tautomerase family protein [Xanthomonas hortorum]MCE4369638.1 tautomerase family protein [Xanthomonas hortorum pv. hederae]MDC8637136.1 tautomerase family protein [Xanthomonas hortorum pv. hederae]PPU86181.1 tautomerase family protein [Xanthomonas hortorum pv. hederae]PUF01245.1 tautomerase family protein [Xanthomonas hortorum pv. hederae]
MPLVRIDFIKHPDPERGRKIGKVVYAALTGVIGVPANDNFQLITEHERDHFVYDPGYLGIERSDGLVYIQITLNEGRTTELKQALFRAIADGLAQQLGMRQEDVFIYLVEVRKENWSFGNGVAQYAG